MKVYLLIESYGDLGDYHEYVHSIYLDKNKAESVKAELEIETVIGHLENQNEVLKEILKKI